MKQLIFLILIIVFSKNLIHSQSATKCFEIAKTFENNNMLDSALNWYYKGMKGAHKNFEFGYNNYFRIMPITLQQKYNGVINSSSSDKLSMMTSIRNFIIQQRDGWDDQTAPKVLPDWEVYYSAFKSAIKNKVAAIMDMNNYNATGSAEQELIAFITNEATIWKGTDKMSMINLDDESANKISN